MEFYVSEPVPSVNIYQDGEDRARLEAGILNYAGPIAEGSAETIDLSIRCAS